MFSLIESDQILVASFCAVIAVSSANARTPANEAADTRASMAYKVAGDEQSFNSVSAANVLKLTYAAAVDAPVNRAGILDSISWTVFDADSASFVSPQRIQTFFNFENDPQELSATALSGDDSFHLAMNLFPNPGGVARTHVPSEWAMVLAGLGMIGFIVRRRTAIQ